MRTTHFQLLAAQLIGCLLPAACFPADLREIDSPHYTIQTDLPDDAAREATLRMSKMADEYTRRTRGFSGNLPQRMPFYLYAHDDDFFANGGTRETAGYFDGKSLVVRAAHLDDRLWHTVQHEGFHQFAAATIRGSLPTWLNEGLAEYFGEAVFTGDAYLSGGIPQWRLKRVRETIQDKKFASARLMLNLSLEQWNQMMTVNNYDQAWSMVQFLAHGDGGKYQPALTKYINALSIGQNPYTAWDDSFGEIEPFEQRWQAYWQALPDNPTLDIYAQAETLTLTSYLARSIAARQHYEAFAAFLAAGVAGKIPTIGDDWLPPSLIDTAAARLTELQKLNCKFDLVLGKDQRAATLKCTLPDGRPIIGSFTLRDGRVAVVSASLPSQKR